MSIASKQSQLAFRKTERALLKLASRQDAESVHGFRTASLRLQTLLKELIPVLSRSQRKLVKLLERVRKRAGKVRDLDVQLEALRSLKFPQEPRRKTQLTHGLIELRVKHENKLRKTLTKRIIREIQERSKQASKPGRLESGRDPLTVARKILARALPAVEPGSAAAAANRVPANHPAAFTEESLHRFRIAIKRARYAAEFAPNSAEAGQFIAQLKTLQDAVGNWHDWLTLSETAGKKLGDAGQSSLLVALLRVTGNKFRHAVAALASSPAVQARTIQAQPIQTAPKSVAVTTRPRKLQATTPKLVSRADPAA
jgi:CHAD domain-containing protein